VGAVLGYEFPLVAGQKAVVLVTVLKSVSKKYWKIAVVLQEPTVYGLAG
jgi:hypothetical protein